MTSAVDSSGSLGPEQGPLSVPLADPGAWATAMNNLGLVPVGRSEQQLASDSICIPGYDSSLFLTPVNATTPGISRLPSPPLSAGIPIVKEIIQCKSCTLFPQNPNLPPPSIRERPPGCKTVFVGGLPENATEEIIREVFDQAGDIIAVRKSKKNFCHIRFAQEFMVDKALYLSGYRMYIGSSTDRKNSGRIHVDFAQARDDLYEWESRQRLLASKEQRQLPPPSSPPSMHYSEHGASQLADRLKGDGQFGEAAAILVAWLERGEVSRRSAGNFYSMIQLANGHVRRLVSERAQREEELEQARERFQSAMLVILTQFEQISAVFSAATRQRARDHFSKAQRRNVDIWRKQCEELRSAHSEEIMEIRTEDEMEMCGDDGNNRNPCKRRRLDDSALATQVCTLREENGSLRWQLEACRGEMELLRREQSWPRPRQEQQQSWPRPRQEQQQSWPRPRQEQQLRILQQTTQQQLVGLQEELRTRELALETARDEKIRLEGELTALREQGLHGSAIIGPLKSEKEASLLGIISAFLHVHPFGANIEYLWSYIQRLDTKVSAGELEGLMVRLPHMFKQELTGVGATLEKRWKFCGFQGLKSA